MNHKAPLMIGMNSRTLGKNGFEVSEVGLGCWQLGGDFGNLTEETALEILRESEKSGVSFFDTANVYGAGKSETAIGKYLKQRATPAVVATKFGRGPDVFPDQYTEEKMRRSVEGSCERLGVDCLDLLQLHCIPMAAMREGKVFDWLRKFQDEGLIKHFGASVESIEEGLVCMEQEGLLSLQVIFNIFRQKLITDLFPQAQEKGVGIIVRLPLASGLLSGKFSKETRFPENDHRNFNRDGQKFNVGETFAGLPFEKGVDAVEAVRKLAPNGVSLAKLALRWILDFEAVSVVIPGASSVKQAAENVVAAEMDPLPQDLHEALSKVYQEQAAPHIRGPY